MWVFSMSDSSELGWDSASRTASAVPGYAQWLAHERNTELDRLRSLEAMADPNSFALLEHIGVRPDWRCLELGGGAGSVAWWLGEHCAGGRVIVTDIDTRFLGDLDTRVEVPRDSHYQEPVR